MMSLKNQAWDLHSLTVNRLQISSCLQYSVHKTSDKANFINASCTSLDPKSASESSLIHPPQEPQYCVGCSAGK